MTADSESRNELVVSESFLIGCIGLVAGMFGGFLTFLLRSRCSKIKCCGIECERSVPTTPVEPIEVRTVSISN